MAREGARTYNGVWECAPRGGPEATEPFIRELCLMEGENLILVRRFSVYYCFVVASLCRLKEGRTLKPIRGPWPDPPHYIRQLFGM